MSSEKRYAVGVDLGGTTIKYAIVDSEGSFLFEGILPTPASEGAEAVTSQIIRAIDLCRDYAAEQGITLCGAGIGTPGVISADGREVVGGAENIAGWEGVALADAVEAQTALTIRLDNDANLMALAETMFGAAKGSSDVVFLTIGTGIGGGVLINGKLRGGYQNRGMELGHVVLIADGEQCPCGAHGCFEHYASTSALVRRYKERCAKAGTPREDADGRAIVEAYHAGDSVAMESMEEHWRFVAQGVRSYINIFAPQRVVIGGGISEAGEFYFDKIRQYVASSVMDVCGSHSEIVAAKLGNRAGCLGAAGLIL